MKEKFKGKINSKQNRRHSKSHKTKKEKKHIIGNRKQKTETSIEKQHILLLIAKYLNS